MIRVSLEGCLVVQSLATISSDVTSTVMADSLTVFEFDFGNPLPCPCTANSGHFPADKTEIDSVLLNIPITGTLQEMIDDDYATGLWGEQRYGVGAFYFSADVVATPNMIRVSLEGCLVVQSLATISSDVTSTVTADALTVFEFDFGGDLPTSYTFIPDPGLLIIADKTKIDAADWNIPITGTLQEMIDDDYATGLFGEQRWGVGAFYFGADVVATPDYGKAPLDSVLSCSLDMTLSAIAPQYEWTFGDGFDSSEVSPKHLFTMPGNFTVTLLLQWNWTDGSGIGSLTMTTTVAVTSPIALAVLDKCYEVGLGNSQQGTGPRDITGLNWVWPALFVSGDECVDEYNQARQIVFDNATGTFREISRIEGPTGTGLTKVWTDAAPAGANPSEIVGFVELAEITGALESFFIQALNGHVNTRPYTPAADGGYRDAQQIDVSVFLDDAQTASTNTLDATIGAEITFKVEQDAKRGRVRVDFAAAELFITGIVSFWRVADAKDDSQAENTEMAYQKELVPDLAWVTRTNVSPIIERIGQAQISGYAKAAGPDGNNDSAIHVLRPGLTVKDITAAIGCLLFWARSITTVQVGGVIISLDQSMVKAVTTSSPVWSLYYIATEVSGLTGVLLFPYSNGHNRLFDIRAFGAVSISSGAIADYAANVLDPIEKGANYIDAY